MTSHSEGTSEEEYVANSLTEDSENDEDRDVPAKKRCCYNKKRCSRGKVNTEEKTNQRRKKTSKHTSAKKKQKHARRPAKKYAKNITYASKLSCLDIHVVQEFLSVERCDCENQCIKKLCELQTEGSAQMIYTLRQQRFAGTHHSDHVL